MLNNIANTSLALAKVAGKGVLKHVFFIGFSLCLFIFGLFLFNSSGEGGTSASGHTGIFGAIIGVFYLFTVDFWPMLLCTTSLLLFPFLYFTLINKGIIHGALFQLWKKNLEGWFITKITNYTDKYLSGNNRISNINDKATLKLRLIKDIKNDKENSRWQRRILSFILKKVQLDEFDTNNPDAKISDFLVMKATEFVSDLGEPSNTPLYLTFLIQIAVLILVMIFK